MNPTEIIDKVLNDKNRILTDRNYVGTKGIKGSNGRLAFGYEVKSEEPLDILRKMYVAAESNFIKNVIVEVGKAKFYTERQIEMICQHFIDNDIVY
jgi:hypothetical protein